MLLDARGIECSTGLGLLGGRAPALPRAAGDGLRRGGRAPLAALHARPHLDRRPTSTRWSRRSARPSSAPRRSPRTDEGRRRHVGRRRLGRGRGPRARGRPRRHRHPPRPLAQPRVVPLGGARLLHDRGRQRRAPRGRRDRHPVLRLGPLRALPRGRRRGLHGRVRRRPHAQPVPAVQREDQVRRRARPGAGARLRRRRHRPLRPAAHRAPTASVEMHRAVDHGKDQSYVLGVLDPGAARPLAVPARRHPEAAGARGGRARAGCWSPTSPTPTTSASSPTATTPAGCARSSATGRPTTAARSSTRRRARSSAATTAPTASPSASARACGSARRRPTASRASCSTSSRSRARSPSGRARR